MTQAGLSKALAAEIRRETAAATARRKADKRQRKQAEAAARAASRVIWIGETAEERKDRLEQEKAERGRAKARRRADPALARLTDAASAAGVPDAQRDPSALGLVKAPRIAGYTSSADETVRKFTRVEILERSGVLERHEAAACEWFADVAALAWDTVGCTANYAGASGGGMDTFDLLARNHAQVRAREDYAMALEHIPAQYKGVFEAVVCRNETISGVAARAFDNKRSQAENKVRAAVKLCANQLYGRIAPLLGMPGLDDRRPAPSRAEEQPAAAAPIGGGPSLSDQVRDAAARATEAGVRPDTLAVAPWVRDVLVRETGDGELFEGLTIIVREEWVWGWLLGRREPS